MTQKELKACKAGTQLRSDIRPDELLRVVYNGVHFVRVINSNNVETSLAYGSQITRGIVKHLSTVGAKPASEPTSDNEDVIGPHIQEPSAHPYNDLSGLGYCFDCGLIKSHPEANHTSEPTVRIETFPQSEGLHVRWNAYSGKLWAQVAQDGPRFILNVTDSSIPSHPSLYAREFASLEDATGAGREYLWPSEPTSEPVYTQAEVNAAVDQLSKPASIQVRKTPYTNKGHIRNFETSKLRELQASLDLSKHSDVLFNALITEELEARKEGE